MLLGHVDNGLRASHIHKLAAKLFGNDPQTNDCAYGNWRVHPNKRVFLGINLRDIRSRSVSSLTRPDLRSLYLGEVTDFPRVLFCIGGGMWPYFGEQTIWRYVVASNWIISFKLLKSSQKWVLIYPIWFNLTPSNTYSGKTFRSDWGKEKWGSTMIYFGSIDFLDNINDSKNDEFILRGYTVCMWHVCFNK